ncbi:MAG: hypothetical protein P8016_08870 [Sedimentisphaerales bacterium]
MFRICMVCATTTLLLSTASFGIGNILPTNIGQTQSFELYGTNPLSIVGRGWASSSNSSSADQDQSIKKLATLTQSEKGTLSQRASLCAQCGTVRVRQEGGAAGSQDQLLTTIGRKSMAKQGQSLEAGLAQRVLKNFGSGSGQASQRSFADQSQSIVSAGTTMNQSQSVGAAQTANISGSGWGSTLAANTISVVTSQSQTSK